MAELLTTEETYLTHLITIKKVRLHRVHLTYGLISPSIVLYGSIISSCYSKGFFSQSERG